MAATSQALNFCNKNIVHATCMKSSSSSISSDNNNLSYHHHYNNSDIRRHNFRSFYNLLAAGARGRERGRRRGGGGGGEEGGRRERRERGERERGISNNVCMHPWKAEITHNKVYVCDSKSSAISFDTFDTFFSSLFINQNHETA